MDFHPTMTISIVLGLFAYSHTFDSLGFPHLLVLYVLSLQQNIVITVCYLIDVCIPCLHSIVHCELANFILDLESSTASKPFYLSLSVRRSSYYIKCKCVLITIS